MKRSVGPDCARIGAFENLTALSRRVSRATVSNTRTVVVPTATIRCALPFLAAASFEIENDSPCIRCSARFSEFAVRQNFFDAQQHIVDLCRRFGSHFAAGLDQTFPARRSKFFQKQKLNSAVIRKSARGQDAGVVENKQVALPQKAFQIAKLSMF